MFYLAEHLASPFRFRVQAISSYSNTTIEVLYIITIMPFMVYDNMRTEIRSCIIIECRIIVILTRALCCTMSISVCSLVSSSPSNSLLAGLMSYTRRLTTSQTPRSHYTIVIVIICNIMQIQ